MVKRWEDLQQEDQDQDTTAKLQGSLWMFLTGFLYVSVLSRLVSY